MSRNIRVEPLNQIPLEKQQVELVERKGIGHPDSIADGVAESISRALCRTYMEEAGVYLHHNTDQGEVVAGQSQPKFGGGRIIRPIYLLIDGRATKEFEGHLFPTDSIAVEAAHDYLRETIPNLDHDRGLIVDCRLGVGSTDLTDVFRPCNSKVPRANDTSFGVGHAPFSETETIVREVSPVHRRGPLEAAPDDRPGRQGHGPARRRPDPAHHRLRHGRPPLPGPRRVPGHQGVHAGRDRGPLPEVHGADRRRRRQHRRRHRRAARSS